MAVRRQLRLHFQEPRLGGGITVERAGSEAGRRSCRQQQHAPRGVLVSGRPALRLEHCALFQCRRCRAVLGDSLQLCAQEEERRLLACLKVTGDVVVDDNLMVCVEGELIGCTYNMLYCRSCKVEVGFRLYCSKSLAYLRGFFCLFKDNIICYLLQTKTTIEASKMIFPIVSLKEHVQKLKENLVKVHMRIELLLKKLEELNQQRTMTEKQGYKASPHGQVSRCVKMKLKN
ncbi:protein Mis18-beta [Tiliqua scincoides]|uniref:protein Mis18-beta n=1 Tax=Tiliqua scincoides TaxID=71010 RepID=UPI00346327A5